MDLKKNDIKPRTVMLNSAPYKHLKLRNLSLLTMTMHPSITLPSKTTKKCDSILACPQGQQEENLYNINWDDKADMASYFRK